MRASLHRLVPFALIIVFAASPALAQETTGRLEGHVVDEKGEPIPSVNVIASSPALQGTRGARTDADGSFTLLALAVGQYTVTLTHAAYQPVVLKSVRVQLGQTTSLENLQLKTQVYELPELVVAGQAMIDPGSTVLGENLSQEQYQALPIARDYKSIATLLPLANESTLGDPVNFAGATGLENRFFVDGVDVTDPYRSATATNLPYNFVKEVQVKAGGYEAEYRSSLGGTVNAVTYSGGNRVTGQVFGFYTSNGFSATPKSVPGSSKGKSYAYYDVGFGIGGPVRKDRLWYYGAYNPSFSREDVTIPGFGNYPDRSTVHSFAGKLTWRANEKNTLALTTLGDPNTGRTVTSPLVPPGNVDPFLARIRRGGVNVVVEGRHMIRDNLLLETSLSRAIRNEDSTPETERGRTEIWFIDSLGVQSGGGGPWIQTRSGLTMATLRATWIQGTQNVKAGVEYRDTRVDFDIYRLLVTQASATLYASDYSSFKGHVGSRLPSVFLQHEWHPIPRLSVNDGLRWDGQYWISSEGKVAQTILDQWQPRLGVTYQPGTIGTQKISASFGRFYQDLTMGPLLWYYNAGNISFLATYDHDPRIDPAGADTLGYLGGTIQPEIVGLKGQYTDEFTLGYERQLGSRLKMGLRGVRRALGQGLEDGYDFRTGSVGLSNPGLGPLRAFPKMTRRYLAMEVSLDGQAGNSVSFLASYVLSRNYGNYEGLFDSQYGNPFPNATALYDVPDQLVNATGLLPNDRPHVLKLSGSYRAARGVTLGAVSVFASGMPRSEIGGTPIGPPYGGFIGARGSHGRTPFTADLSLRLGYEPTVRGASRFHPKFTVDVLHVASQRKPVRYDEVHYRALDSSGNQIDPNPNYGMPIAFQPPMATRMGVEIGF